MVVDKFPFFYSLQFLVVCITVFSSCPTHVTVALSSLNDIRSWGIITNAIEKEYLSCRLLLLDYCSKHMTDITVNLASGLTRVLLITVDNKKS